MTRYRFVHTADLHLDSPLKSLALRNPALADATASASRRVLERIIDICMEEEADALLIAGDLYDGSLRSMKTAAFLTRQMQRLHEAGIDVFMIRGNHDAESTITRQLDLPPNVHVFPAKGGMVRIADKGVAIHGVSFSDRHAPESLLSRFRAPEGGMINIALLHTSLAGSPNHDVYAPCSVSELSAVGMDYWALGHVHKRQVHSTIPLVVMPGMPQGRDIGENGPKSVTIGEATETGITIRERVTSVAEFALIEHDLTGAADWTSAMTMIRDAMAAARSACLSQELVLRHRLSASPDMAWRLMRDIDMLGASIGDAGEAIGHVWLDKLLVGEAGLPAEASKGSTSDPVFRLAALMSEVGGDSAFMAEAESEMAALVSELPPSLRDRFGSDAGSGRDLLGELLIEGSRHVLARLARRPSGEEHS